MQVPNPEQLQWTEEQQFALRAWIPHRVHGDLSVPVEWTLKWEPFYWILCKHLAKHQAGGKPCVACHTVFVPQAQSMVNNSLPQAASAKYSVAVALVSVAVWIEGVYVIINMAESSTIVQS